MCQNKEALYLPFRVISRSDALPQVQQQALLELIYVIFLVLEYDLSKYAPIVWLFNKNSIAYFTLNVKVLLTFEKVAFIGNKNYN